MSKFKLETRRYNLKELGEEWKECYLDFEPISYAEAQEFLDLPIDSKETSAVKESSGRVFKVLEKKFIQGMGIDKDNKKMEIRKEELKELPVEVIVGVINFLLVKKPSPNI